MKFRSLLSVAVLAAGLVFLTACMCSNVGAPTEATNKAFAAMVKCDFDTFAKFCHGEMAQEAKDMSTRLAQMAAAAKKGDAKAKAEHDGIVSGYKSMKVSFKNEKIEGDFAVIDVFIRVDGEKGPVEKREKAYVQKIGRNWMLITANDYFKANPDKIKIAHPSAKKAEPKKAEPKAAEPKKAEQPKAEPKKAEPKAAEPKAAK